MRVSMMAVAGACLALLSPASAFADPPDVHVDVPANSRGLEVNVVEDDLGPGQSSGWHKHPGYEIDFVLSGAVNVTIGASPIRHVAQGDTFEVERGAAHNVANASTTAPAALLVTYLKDKNSPVATPAEPPAIH